MVRKMIWGTLIVEAVGAVLYMFVYIPRYGLAKGIWVAVFTAVSAFCNAGMDLMGADSMMAYVSHPLMNLVTMALIVIGGLGFFVWWDLLAAAAEFSGRKICRVSPNAADESASASWKLCVTAALIFGRWLGIFYPRTQQSGHNGEFDLMRKDLGQYFPVGDTSYSGICEH